VLSKFGDSRTALIALLLGVLVVAAFGRALKCDFVNYDDDSYITDNPHVQAGITSESVRWAFTTTLEATWQPMVWLSYMLDHRLYVLNPVGFHATNLIFHLANVLLLFLVLARMTGCVWRSAFVAALFGVHPIHVESVAWVAERKDVLSGFFWMLTMGAYALYCERPTRKR
jgi:hypothetical protein